MDRSTLIKAVRGGSALGALVAALALGGCGPGEDPTVAAVAEAARELSQGLPKAAEMSSITAVRAEGNRLILDMTVEPYISPEMIQAFRERAETADRLRLCGEVTTMRLLGTGATIVSRYSRPGGPRFETSITTCAAAPPAAPPPDLAAEIASAVRTMRIGLPRTVDSITTMTGIRAEGTNVFYEMSINRDLSRAEIAALRPNLQTMMREQLCADPESSRLIRQGATMIHEYTDPSGDRFTLIVPNCPPAAGGGG